MNTRLLHSNEYVEFVPQWHMYALCINMPELNGADGGLQRQVQKIDFPLTFTNIYGPTEDNPHVFPEITDRSQRQDCPDGTGIYAHATDQVLRS